MKIESSIYSFERCCFASECSAISIRQSIPMKSGKTRHSVSWANIDFSPGICFSSQMQQQLQFIASGIKYILLLTRFSTEICQKNVDLKHTSQISLVPFQSRQAMGGYNRMVQIRATADGQSRIDFEGNCLGNQLVNIVDWGTR